MSHLALAFPRAAGMHFPLSRDQIVLLLTALTQAFLGLDTYLAHVLDGTIRGGEWVPILFGPAACVALLLAGALAGLRWWSVAMGLAFAVLLASVAVGVAGVWLHGLRALLPDAPAGSRVTLYLFVWGPPVLGPLAFVGVAIMGMSAAWHESPADSGRLSLPGGRVLPMPFSKTRAYYFLVAFGILAALISSVLDHARSGFEDAVLWLATGVAVFATAAAVTLGAVERPTTLDVRGYLGAMVALVLIGLIGAWQHVQANLVGDSTFVVERFLRGAPFLAPLLFSYMGTLGIIIMMAPASDKAKGPSQGWRKR